MIHIALHFIIPALITGLYFRKTWQPSYLLMMATMLVDIDHLLANPIYDPGRCSIGFHPLHEWWFIVIYLALCFIPGAPKTRLIGLGLCVHMALDAIDCQVISGLWTFY